MKYQAAIFDWAGTMVDFGSFAPMGAFVEAFDEFGLAISVAQARAPMGMAKRDHIAAILNDPDVRDAFQIRFNRPSGEADIDRVYEIFVPLNESVAGKYADLVPGALDTFNWLKQSGIAVGSTTGYTRSIMQHVIPVAESQGYVPSCVVCSDEVANGRPAADAMLMCAEYLGLTDPGRFLKVDDTEPGIGEGVSFGCTTVGVALSGNFAGMTPDELAAASEEEIAEIRERATLKLKQAGADFVIDSVAELPALIEKLNTST